MTDNNIRSTAARLLFERTTCQIVVVP